MNTIEEDIATILADQFKISREVIGTDVTFESLQFDSLVLIELGLVLGKEFSIVIEDGELTDDMTIGQLADLALAKGAVVRWTA